MTTTARPILTLVGTTAGPTDDDSRGSAPLRDATSPTNEHDLAEPRHASETPLAHRSARWREAFAAMRSGYSVVSIIWVNDRAALPVWNPYLDSCRAEEERGRGFRALAARRIPIRSGVTIDLSHLPSADVIEARETLIAVAAKGGVHAVWMSSTRSLGEDADGARAFVRLLETGVRVLLPHRNDNASSVLQIERALTDE